MTVSYILMCDRVTVHPDRSLDIIDVQTIFGVSDLPVEGRMTAVCGVVAKADECEAERSMRFVIQNPDMKVCGGSGPLPFSVPSNPYAGPCTLILHAEVGVRLEAEGIYQVIALIDEEVAWVEPYLVVRHTE